MTDDLSDADWQELTRLIAEAPPDRLRAALGLVSASARPAARPMSARPPLLTGVERLLHLADISSGGAFDRALLVELRRLSLH
jgi:hypothetical protein